MSMKYSLLFFLWMMSRGLWSQQYELRHYVISADSVVEIQVLLSDSVDYRFWPGNYVLVEQRIALEHPSKYLFVHLLNKTDRYALDTLREGSHLRISAKEIVRESLLDKDGIPIEEQITYIIYLPRAFRPQSGGIWRKEETNPDIEEN